MLRLHTRRPLVLAALVGGMTLGACTNEGSGRDGTNQGPAISGRDGGSDENAVGAAPDQAANTRADRAGSIGPGSSLGTSNVNPTRQSTKTQVDSIPDVRPDAGPGGE
jgi:hypothetical protein